MHKIVQSRRRLATLVALVGAVAAMGTLVATQGLAGSAEVLSVNPSQDLADAQVVQVSGSGMAASSTIIVVQCNNADLNGTPLATPTSNCDPSHAVATSSNASGAFGPVSFTVHEVGDQSRCVLGGNFPCYIRASIAAAGQVPATHDICFGAAGTCAAQVTTTTTSGGSTTTTTSGQVTTTTVDGATTTTAGSVSSTTTQLAGAGSTTSVAVSGAGASRSTSGSQIPRTGLGGELVGALGVGLVAAGAALVRAGRLRRHARSSA